MSRYLYPDFRPAFARLTADVQVVFDIFGPMVDRIATNLPISTALLEMLQTVENRSAHAPKLEGGQWSARAVEILRASTRDPIGNLRDCICAAFDDPDQRVRGSAWCAVAEALRDCGTKARASEILSREFLDRRFAGGTADYRQSEAEGFCVLASSCVERMKVQQFLRGLRESYLEKHGGNDAVAIKSSPTSAAEFLSHFDGGRRLAALRVLASSGRAATRYARRIADMICCDSNPDVRLAAIVAYGALFERTRDKSSLCLLAELVLDAGRPVQDRLAAYHGLLRICGDTRPNANPISASIGSDSDPERDGLAAVNWGFVEGCRAGNGAENASCAEREKRFGLKPGPGNLGESTKYSTIKTDFKVTAGPSVAAPPIRPWYYLPTTGTIPLGWDGDVTPLLCTIPPGALGPLLN